MNFVDALVQNDEEQLRKIPKSDIHNHAGRGGNIQFISEKMGKVIAEPPAKYDSLSHMQEWFNQNIKTVCVGTEGQLLRWEACFSEAKRNCIKRLSLSFSRLDVESVGGMEPFMEILEKYHQQYCPDTFFEPELTYGRNCDVEDEMRFVDDLMTKDFFRSIDICNGEFQQPIQNFIPLYDKADSHHLTKRAHVGEFGTAQDVKEAVEVLGLQEVHHGVAAATSDEVMDFLRDNGIQLNICPSSNVMLDVVKRYDSHPIRILLHHGVKVTINTDDLLIFNSSIEQEYQKLYQAGNLSAEELNQIRLQGLKMNTGYISDMEG